MSTAAEAETGGLYINARKAAKERNILEEMGHKQQAAAVHPHANRQFYGQNIVDNSVQPKRTKATDMRFHWLLDWAN